MCNDLAPLIFPQTAKKVAEERHCPRADDIQSHQSAHAEPFAPMAFYMGAHHL
jgi:hypothetical protein